MVNLNVVWADNASGQICTPVHDPQLPPPPPSSTTAAATTSPPCAVGQCRMAQTVNCMGHASPAEPELCGISYPDGDALNYVVDGSCEHVCGTMPVVRSRHAGCSLVYPDGDRHRRPARRAATSVTVQIRTPRRLRAQSRTTCAAES